MNNVKSQNLLELIPSKLCEWEEHDGKVFVLIPRFSNKFGKKYLLPLMKHPFNKLELDEIGSFIWHQIDGKKNIYEICELAASQFGDKIEPAFDRIGKFFSYLKLSKAVEFTNENK